MIVRIFIYGSINLNDVVYLTQFRVDAGLFDFDNCSLFRSMIVMYRSSRFVCSLRINICDLFSWRWPNECSCQSVKGLAHLDRRVSFAQNPATVAEWSFQTGPHHVLKMCVKPISVIYNRE